MSTARTLAWRTAANSRRTRVAGRVAVGVVHPLEVVEVDQHERQGPSVRDGPVELGLDPADQRLPVEDAGQRIDRGQGPGFGERGPPAGRRRPAASGSSRPFVSTMEDGSVAPARAIGDGGDPANLATADGGRESGAAEHRADEGDDQRSEQELGAGRDRHRRFVPLCRHPALGPGARGSSGRHAEHWRPGVPVRYSQIVRAGSSADRYPCRSEAVRRAHVPPDGWPGSTARRCGLLACWAVARCEPSPRPR